MTDVVLTETLGCVLLIKLNRPEALNAINGALADQFLKAVDHLDADPKLTVGVLIGAGRGFCAGMDLKEFAMSGSPKAIKRFLVDGCRKPLIAAIEGFALAGGLELALACDLLVVARGAKLGIPEARVGLFAAGGALLRLPSRLPVGIALELALTAEPMTAEQAHGYGLVNRLSEPGETMADALELASRISANAPLGVMASKRLIRETQGRTESEFWALQHHLADDVFRSEDAKEGPRAFAEKRSPEWTGR